MQFSLHIRRNCLPTVFRGGLLCAALSTSWVAAGAQTSAGDPVSARQHRLADDAYLEGARLLVARQTAAAEKSFARAVALDPGHTEYAMALAVAKEHHVTELVQDAAREKAAGRGPEAAKLLEQARQLAPDNPILTQHAADMAGATPEPVADAKTQELARLGGPIHLKPAAGTQTFHRRGDARSLLREVYAAFGIRTSFDASIEGGQPLRLDLENADFETASRIAMMMSHTFAVPLMPDQVLLAKNDQETRDRLEPQIEETVYVPAATQEQLNELSNIAKNIFDLKQVQVSPGAGLLVMRGNEESLRLMDATYADLLDGGSDVVVRVRMYEFDRTHLRDIGATLPSSAGVINIAAAAQTVISQNQALIQQGIAAGLINTNQGYFQTIVNELIFLVGAGVNVPQFTGLLGTFGGGVLGYSGLFLGSNSSFNLLLNSSETRMLDDVQMRVGDKQDAIFRAGVRYPITTSTYSSGITSSLAASLQGVTINGTSVASLLGQLANSASTTVPQISYEDLGLTLKAHPQVLKSGNVAVHLEMKIEALGAGSLNNIPVLDSRALTSDIIVAPGQVAMLTSEISNSEQHSIEGLPGLSEIPGFQGTDRRVEKDTTELLITIEPRIVRRRSPVTTTRRMVANVSIPQQ